MDADLISAPAAKGERLSRDLYAEVTAKIIAALEQGVAPWICRWRRAERFSGRPYNMVTGHPYRGINVALLCAPQYSTAAWMTFKQAQAVGARIRRGEKASLIVFYKPIIVKDKHAQPDADGNPQERVIPLLRAFNLFNVAQIDGLPGKFEPQTGDDQKPTREAKPDDLLSQASIEHGGDKACYEPSRDIICLPHIAEFASSAEYYGAALHELTHWTGHSTRLNRDYGRRFADSAYAREELVAEMGAAFLCAHCGIAGKLQHAEYIGTWLEVLKRDKRAILVAAAAAQKAVDFVINAKIHEADA
jgi:antirestriction protein ArdC